MRDRSIAGIACSTIRWAVRWAVIGGFAMACAAIGCRALGLSGRPILAEELPAPAWWRVDEGATGERTGSVLVHAPDSNRLLLLGPAEGAPFVQAFDPDGRTWSQVSERGPAVERFHPYYQTAYDPATRTVYCLSGGSVLHSLSPAASGGEGKAKGSWKVLPPAPVLDGLSWHAMALEPAGSERSAGSAGSAAGRLVVVGADKKVGGIGWTRTVVLDIATGTWSVLEVDRDDRSRARLELDALAARTGDLAGRIRLAWFRDPRGVGREEEIEDLASRCEEIARLPRAASAAASAAAATSSASSSASFAESLSAVRDLLGARRTLDALKAARALLREVEEAAEAASPAPRSRRNSPLAFDPRSGLFVLFGGDHEDYLMNDTWTLDLERGSWRRMSPAVAPGPRAGHALFPLPRAGGVALYEGYLQTSSDHYGAAPYRSAEPIELWRYDPTADRWDILGAWPHPKRGDLGGLPPTGHFYGYASEWYSPPAIAADAEDRLVLAAHPGRVWYLPWEKMPARTWMLEPGIVVPDGAGSEGAGREASGRDALGRPPNERLYRTGFFRAAWCEAPDAPEPTGIDALPANRWTRLPAPPRNPCQGCRQRDWGTATWDSDRDQILMWGGGHCVRSASTVAHASPVSGRIVEGFDADEPYGANGGGGFDSSVLNRPWVSAHNYNHYAYDPRCRLLVSARGYLYDPDGMDWLRIEPYPAPFAFDWGHTVVETSPRGAVAWARKEGSEAFGLWLFDREGGWVDLEPRGALFGPYCDAHGMVHDAKRDRMVIGGVGGGYLKTSDGSFLEFDFATRSLRPIVPENRELARTRNARELAYVDHADWILIGEQLRPGGGEGGTEEEGTGEEEEEGEAEGEGDTETEAGKRSEKRTYYTRVYDCARNRMLLLDAGRVPDGHSTGWMYDAKRKLAYVFTFRGETWALRIEPSTARLVERP